MEQWVLVFAIFGYVYNDTWGEYIRSDVTAPTTISGFTSYENCNKALIQLRGDTNYYKALSATRKFYPKGYGINDGIVFSGLNCIQIK